MVSRSVLFGVRSRKLSNVGQSLGGWPNIYYLELLRVSESTLSCWSRLHLLSLAPTNTSWVRVVDYGPFSLCVIRREGLWSSSGDINRLIMMMISLYVSYSRQCVLDRTSTVCNGIVHSMTNLCDRYFTSVIPRRAHRRIVWIVWTKA
jgi:hypothetical protein